MIEKLVLQHLMYSQQYMRKALPFLKAEYFESPVDRHIFENIKSFVDKYNKNPTQEVLKIEIEKSTISDDIYNGAVEVISGLKEPEPQDEQWLLDKTEEFCQESALVNALRQSAKILENTEKGVLTKGMIPQMLSEALAVSFDNSIGHDYLEDWQDRFDYYHLTESKIPFDIAILNKITKGGILRKTLTVLMAGTGVGKSLAMCSFAAANLELGMNVLYISNEMAELQIGKRLDAHLLDITMDELDTIPINPFKARMEKLNSRVGKGRLIVKEFGNSTAGAANYRHLLNELKLKENFVPDIIYVDYLNICISSRLKRAQANSYEYIKSIAEELRALAIEFDVPIVTATQLNREGFVNSDPGLEHTSESFGLPATADLMLAMITNEELASMGQILFKQLKNRYRDENLDRRFIVGIDRDKMRFHDVGERAQQGIVNEPVIKKAASFDPSVLQDFK